MTLVWRKRVRLLPWLTANLSKGGASLSAHRGRVTVNSHGRVSIRLWKGFSIRLP